jgi:hypothetical protein
MQISPASVGGHWSAQRALGLRVQLWLLAGGQRWFTAFWNKKILFTVGFLAVVSWSSCQYLQSKHQIASSNG